MADLTARAVVANRIIEITPNGMIDSLLSFEEYLASDRIREQRGVLAGVAV